MTGRVVAVAMVKDEADVIRGLCEHTADEVDWLIVSDNGSTDGTRDILADLAASGFPITVLDDPVPAYLQAQKMTALADRAHAEGAEWVVPVDADELWVARAGRLREVLPGLPYPVAHACLINHLRTDLDVDDPDPFRSMVWRQPAPQKLGKVAVRWQIGARLHQGNHGVTLPTGEPGGLQVLEIHHFPIRSPQHLVRKAHNGAAAYAAARDTWPDMPADWGRHWKAWGQLLDAHGPEALHEAYRAHWHYRSPVDAGLVEEPAPYLRWRDAANQ